MAGALGHTSRTASSVYRRTVAANNQQQLLQIVQNHTRRTDTITNFRLHETPRVAREVQSSVEHHSREHNGTGEITIEGYEQLMTELKRIENGQAKKYGEELSQLNRILEDTLQDLEAVRDNRTNLTPEEDIAYTTVKGTVISYTERASNHIGDINTTWFQWVKEGIEKNPVTACCLSVLLGVVSGIFAGYVPLLASAAPWLGFGLAVCGLTVCAYISYNAEDEPPPTTVWGPDIQSLSQLALD